MSETKNIPPIKFKRNEYGLFEHLNYIFNDYGYIDYRAMIPNEHLVPNKSLTSETDVTKLEDKQLLILLSGIKKIAQIRGYTDVSYDIVQASNELVAGTCSIAFIPNYETDNRMVVFSAAADASLYNTHGFGKDYLTAIFENRALVRCVRNFLQINIVGQDECGPNVEYTVNQEKKLAEHVEPLKLICERKHISFGLIKSKLVKGKCENAETFEDWEDLNEVSKPIVLDLISRVKKAKTG